MVLPTRAISSLNVRNKEMDSPNWARDRLLSSSSSGMYFHR